MSKSLWFLAALMLASLRWGWYGALGVFVVEAGAAYLLGFYSAWRENRG